MKQNINISLRSVLLTTLATMLACLASVSCVRDSFDRLKVKSSDGKIHFEVNSYESLSDTDTKSGVKQDPIILVSDHNDTLYMFVRKSPNKEMPLCGNEKTKGTPITTSNISTEYGSFNVVAFPKGTVSSPYLTDLAEYDSSSNTWSTDPQYSWPNNQKLDFYAYAPVDAGMTDITYPDGGGKLGFTYSLPSGGQTSGDNYIDAKNQKDILCAITTDYGDKTAQGNVSFTFKHALSAIKFKGGTIVGAGTLQSISLKNLSSGGKAEFNSSGSSFVWTNLDSKNHTYTQTFNVGLSEQTDPQDITATDESTTFMMIPQTIDGSTSILELLYLKEGASTPIKFSVAIPAIVWEAGYTYTYKLSIDSDTVEVEVDDDVNDNVKDQLVVANSGNADAYLRVALVGGWKNSADELAEDWDESQGTFENFPGADWVKGEDGYYYYTYPVNGATSDPVETGTKLFTKYTAPESPIDGGYLVLDIMVQGVKYDPAKTNVTKAWGSEVASILKTK